MVDISFEEIDRPTNDGLLKRETTSTWQPLITAVVRTLTNGRAIQLAAPPNTKELKAFKTGLYARMKGHNLTTRCNLSNDRAHLVIWAEPRKPDQKPRGGKKRP